jgi:uncharacterized repeat protein (TIGR03803 family)
MKSTRFFPQLVIGLAIALSLAVCAQAQTITYLTGQDLEAAASPSLLIQATDGNFYAVGFSEIHPNGYIYRMTPTGETTRIHMFCSQANCMDGDLPLAPILGRDGNLYGITEDGGAATSGTVYNATLDGELTTLYSFCPNAGCADGQQPIGIIQASDGNFYGATQRGGTNVRGGAGTIFSISPSGKFKLL